MIRMTCALAALLSILVGARALAGPPEFVAGELEDLEVRIVKPSKKLPHILELDVTNKGSTTAEPILFILDNPGAKEAGAPKIIELLRTGHSAYGQAGRGVAPRKKVRYWFPRPWGFERKGAGARVAEASFFQGSGFDEPPVTVGKIREREVIDPYNGQEYRRSQFSLTNKLPHPVEVILLLEGEDYRDPMVCLEPIAANAERLIGDDDEGSTYVGRPFLFGTVRGRFDRVKVIDWTVDVDDGTDLAAKLFREAWQARYRWPDPTPAVRGKVRYEVRPTTKPSELKRMSGETTFRLADGKARLDLKGTDPLNHLSAMVARAFGAFTCPSADEILADYRPTIALLGSPTMIEFASIRERTSVNAPRLVRIHNGELVGDQNSRAEARMVNHRVNLQPPEGGGYLPQEETEVSVLRGDETDVERRCWSYTRSAGFWVPETFELDVTDERMVNARHSTRLEFSDLIVELDPSSDPAATALPTGADAEALRTLWDACYRYPRTPVDLVGTFEVESPNTAMDWMTEESSGEITWTGFVGRRTDEGNPRVYDELQVRPSNARSPEVSEQIESLLPARYTIWTRQDLCGRKTFEEQFAGTTIRRESGRFVIDGSAELLSIEEGKGQIQRMTMRDGSSRSYRYDRVGGHVVPVETRWDFGPHESVTESHFREVEDGFLFADRIILRGWFHADFGPETYRFRVRTP